ncbi:DUF6458 family protein [Nocardioides sp. NPDC127503]|uniref:DUF6458 family protein n=1 Tax=Nocardioides sp. NPDC127503 TaxID=3154516 RepID=UPI003322334D
MGYGVGAILLVVGLVLALAVHVSVSGIDLTMIGWILAAVGALVLVLTAVTLNTGGRSRTVARRRHADGTETVEERRTDTL